MAKTLEYTLYIRSKYVMSSRKDSGDYLQRVFLVSGRAFLVSGDGWGHNVRLACAIHCVQRLSTGYRGAFECGGPKILLHHTVGLTPRWLTALQIISSEAL